MKKVYIKPQMEIKRFVVTDVITVSGDTPPAGDLSYADDQSVSWSDWVDFGQLN